MNKTAVAQQAKTTSFLTSSRGILQRKCACGNHVVEGECAECKKKKNGLQRKLTIGSSTDPLEREADRVAEQVMSASPSPTVSRAQPRIHRYTGQANDVANTAPPNVDRALASSGRPLEPAVRQDMEQRFGHDFSQVSIHTGASAEQSAQAMNAAAYTFGNSIVFGAGQFSLGSLEGRRLLAHELVHVVQQSSTALPATTVQRQIGLEPQVDDMDMAAEREFGGSGAPNAQKCGRPSWCPPGFCDPYSSEKLAEYYRSKKAWWLMAGISAAVDSRVVPLWREYLWGGSSPKNLTTDFGNDFTNSPTTKKTTTFLYDELKKTLAATPPSVPLYATTTIDLGTQIPSAIAELDDPSSRNQMNFNIPKDIPGNLAGGIGKDQLSCPSGAKPSPFNDERHASGTVMVTRLSSTDLTVTPVINYLVKDTIDLCPGDCGTTLEQIATVPLSQFEATGISGDVPFTVDFAAPFLGAFTVTAPVSTKAAPPSKKP